MKPRSLRSNLWSPRISEPVRKRAWEAVDVPTGKAVRPTHRSTHHHCENNVTTCGTGWDNACLGGQGTQHSFGN
jgi:hypothetical protein